MHIYIHIYIYESKQVRLAEILQRRIRYLFGRDNLCFCRFPWAAGRYRLPSCWVPLDLYSTAVSICIKISIGQSRTGDRSWHTLYHSWGEHCRYLICNPCYVKAKQWGTFGRSQTPNGIYANRARPMIQVYQWSKKTIFWLIPDTLLLASRCHRKIGTLQKSMSKFCLESQSVNVFSQKIQHHPTFHIEEYDPCASKVFNPRCYTWQVDPIQNGWNSMALQALQAAQAARAPKPTHPAKAAQAAQVAQVAQVAKQAQTADFCGFCGFGIPGFCELCFSLAFVAFASWLFGSWHYAAISVQTKSIIWDNMSITYTV